MLRHDIPADPAARLGDSRLLQRLVESAVELYDLGNCARYSVINVGYEDCNVRVSADTGCYLIKMFSAVREAGVAMRTLRILEDAIAAGVNHPQLIRNRLHERMHLDARSGIQFMVMDFIDGQDFYTLERAPDSAELRLVMEQAARIHSISANPPFVHDPWAVQNLQRLYIHVESSLHSRERTLVEQTIRAMSAIDHSALPVRLVHGDLSKGNVLRSVEGEMVLLDFAVANRYPRIQEIAVVAANLMYGCQTTLEERVDLLCDLYDEWSPLSADERNAAPRYALAAAAMELLGAYYELAYKDNNNAETRQVLEIGRSGLRAGADLIERYANKP